MSFMSELDIEIRELESYFEDTDISIEEPPDFTASWICIKTLNVEINKETLNHILNYPTFDYLQVDEEGGINLIFRR